jgi:hypothetical protein
MWPLLRTFLPVDVLRPQARALTTRLVTFGIAGFLGIVALFYFLDAALLGMIQVMPAWAASLVLGACLVIVAAIVVLIGISIGNREERRARALAAATPPPAMQLAAVATPIVMQVLRHPGKLVLAGLAAGALTELLRKR